MNQELLMNLITVFAIPVAGALATFIVKWVNAQSEQIKAKTNQDKINHYIDILNDTVAEVVVSLNASTVDALKAAAQDGKLTPAEVEEIKSGAIETIYSILGNTGIEILELAFDDLEALIAVKIDKAVENVKGGV
jgi:hypothetical protein